MTSRRSQNWQTFLMLAISGVGAYLSGGLVTAEQVVAFAGRSAVVLGGTAPARRRALATTLEKARHDALR